MTLVGCDHGHESCARCIAKLTRLEAENQRLKGALDDTRSAWWAVMAGLTHGIVNAQAVVQLAYEQRKALSAALEPAKSERGE